MDIIHITPYFYPAWAYGGIPRLSYHMALEQSRAGHNVRVITTDALDAKNRRQTEDCRIEGIKVRVLRNVSNRAAYHYQVFAPTGLGSCKDMLKDFDIMHIHGHRNFLNTAMSYFARKQGLPLVLQPNGTLVNIERRRLLKAGYDFLLGNSQIAATDGFIAVSEAEKKQFMNAGIAAHRIRVIPNGVYIETDTREMDFKKLHGIEGGYVLYLGKITPRKGIEYLVRAVPLFDDGSLKLVIAGNDMGFLARIKSEVRALGLDKRVIFTGLVSGGKKAAAYRDALFTAYVSRDEIFGLVPFESLLCGTPVIVASDCGCGEWVKAADAGHVIEYGDPDAVARIVNNYDEKREAETVERGKRFVRERLSWERVAAEVIEYYEDVIAGRKRQ